MRPARVLVFALLAALATVPASAMHGLNGPGAYFSSPAPGTVVVNGVALQAGSDDIVVVGAARVVLAADASPAGPALARLEIWQRAAGDGPDVLVRACDVAGASTAECRWDDAGAVLATLVARDLRGVAFDLDGAHAEAAVSYLRADAVASSAAS